jgi:Plasmid pRiA4b ORF-3-like protein
MPKELILKITLRDIRPPIWRRARVADDSSLGKLHQVIQLAMGWEDGHLHEFEVGDRRYGDPYDADDSPGADRAYSETSVKLASLVDRGVTRFRYLYDFGDGWDHQIVIEKVQSLDPDRQYPSLIGGKRACPPEDCGGPYGYLRLLEVLADPTDEEHAQLTEWVGGAFDPEHLDLQAVNHALAPVARRRRAQRPKA